MNSKCHYEITRIIDRDYYLTHIKDSFEIFPISAILGPRQCGKATLAHAILNSLKISNSYLAMLGAVNISKKI
ncbi:Predicted ATPase [Rickettsia akari str. Hartford]|uniref:Predicted ATPase n=1 Tax=Rickettsia akari (strain Hartford) TaxID=293614 RepID=A8GPH6_RICAH|nr:ATPase [Rickettsia akari]ABV75301.1 Predicted ATPase [Rickettsia akari str. Hartford]